MIWHSSRKSCDWCLIQTRCVDSPLSAPSESQFASTSIPPGRKSHLKVKCCRLRRKPLDYFANPLHGLLHSKSETPYSCRPPLPTRAKSPCKVSIHTAICTLLSIYRKVPIVTTLGSFCSISMYERHPRIGRYENRTFLLILERKQTDAASIPSSLR